MEIEEVRVAAEEADVGEARHRRGVSVEVVGAEATVEDAAAAHLLPVLESHPGHHLEISEIFPTRAQARG